MNILVTGSAGFIASHLVEALLSDSANLIVGMDNFYTGTKENISYLKSCDKNNKFKFIEADIRDLDKIREIINKHEIEQIYHLAAIVSVQESIKNPLLSNEVNIKGTLNILEASRLCNIKRIVFSSSAAVYGNEPSLPKDENSPTKPISPYGIEKLVGEQYMKLYSEIYGVDTVILRYFNVFGLRQSVTSDYSGVISIFEKKIKNNERPNIYGNGEQYRDFIYVKDVARVNIKAMNTIEASENIFCVGTACRTSINDLVKILSIKYSKNVKPIYLEARCGDIKESISSNTKIKEELKIKNFTNFKEGILNL